MTVYRRGRGPYFAPIPWELQDREDVTAFHISTYAALKRYADFGSDEGAQVSDATVARKAGCSERQVRNCRNDLREWGWLEWDTTITSKGRLNTYVIHSSPPAESAQAAGGGASSPQTMADGPAHGAALVVEMAAGGVRHTVPDGSGTPCRTGPAHGADNLEPVTESHVPRVPVGTAVRPSLDLSSEDEDRPDWNGGVILEAWLKRHPEISARLSPRERGKYGAACKRLASEHTREEVAAAFVGMGLIAPYSMGEAWDPMDLDRKFGKAMAAAANHPKVRERKEAASLEEALRKRQGERGVRA